VLVNACHYFAGLAETLHGATLATGLANFTTYTLREPIGVVAAITPWKLAAVTARLETVPRARGRQHRRRQALGGNSHIDAVARAIGRAGGLSAGRRECRDGPWHAYGRGAHRASGVDRIAFTGSTATGKVVARAALERNARVSLELGGKSPNIVFADASLTRAVDGIIAGIFAASGQTCVAGSRVLVQASVYDEVAALLVARARKLSAGDPLDPATTLGPLASRAQLEKVLGYFEIAHTERLELLTGGRRLDRPGLFVEPTVFGNVANGCRVAREEIFGPVACLLRFADEDEAVAIANDTAYGLAAGVWTENLRRAHRIVGRLRAGTVWSTATAY